MKISYRVQQKAGRFLAGRVPISVSERILLYGVHWLLYAYQRLREDPAVRVIAVVIRSQHNAHRVCVIDVAIQQVAVSQVSSHRRFECSCSRWRAFNCFTFPLFSSETVQFNYVILYLHLSFCSLNFALEYVIREE